MGHNMMAAIGFTFGSIMKIHGPKLNPVKLRDQLEGQSSDNDEVERINEADIPRTSAQENEYIISEDEDIELKNIYKIDTLQKKLDRILDNVDTKIVKCEKEDLCQTFSKRRGNYSIRSDTQTFAIPT